MNPFTRWRQRRTCSHQWRETHTTTRLENEGADVATYTWHHLRCEACGKTNRVHERLYARFQRDHTVVCGTPIQKEVSS